MPSHESRSWMWIEALERVDRADRLHRQFFHIGAPQARRPTWQPPVDVVETAQAFHIHVALPGVDPRALDVLFNGLSLMITGIRPMPCDEPGAAIHRLEIPYGRFERQIDLPVEGLILERRETSNGCLELTLRKPS